MEAYLDELSDNLIETYEGKYPPYPFDMPFSVMIGYFAVFTGLLLSIYGSVIIITYLLLSALLPYNLTMIYYTITVILFFPLAERLVEKSVRKIASVL